MKKIVITIDKELPKDRGDWGGVKPYIRIQRDKTKTISRRKKHKSDDVPFVD